MAPELRTERLILRGLKKSDVPFLNELLSDDEVRRYLGGPVPLSQREAHMSRYFLPIEARTPVCWIVESRVGQCLGMLLLHGHGANDDLQISFMFQSKAWGYSYAFEAVNKVLRFGIEELHVPRILAETQAANLRSCRLLRRLGMAELTRVSRFGQEQVIFVVTKLTDLTDA